MVACVHLATRMNRGFPVEGAGRTLAVVRQFLLATVLLGLVGTGTELLLIGHFDGVTQFIPLVLLAAALAAVVWHLLGPRASNVRALQVIMGMLAAAGMIGIGLHYEGNVEFERELYPSLEGVELMWKALTGATPIFAPGSVTLLGLVGLAYTYRHPCLRRRGGVSGAQEDET